MDVDLHGETEHRIPEIESNPIILSVNENELMYYLWVMIHEAQIIPNATLEIEDNNRMEDENSDAENDLLGMEIDNIICDSSLLNDTDQ